MTTWYAQAGGGDFLSQIDWNDAQDGSGDNQQPATPADGDTYDLNGQTGIYIASGALQADITIVDSIGSNTLELANCTLGGGATGITIEVAATVPVDNYVVLQSRVAGAAINFGGGLTVDPSAVVTVIDTSGTQFVTTGAAAINLLDLSGCDAWPFTDVTSGIGMAIISPTISSSPAPIYYAFLVPTPDLVQLGQQYGYNGNQYTGTLTGGTIPAASDVRHGVAVGETTGTCYVPTASQVLAGINVDATVGNVVLPIASVVLAGVTFGPAGASTGTLEVDNTDIASILADVNAIATNVSSIGAQTANISSLATAAALASAITTITAACASASGFATSSQAASILTDLALLVGPIAEPTAGNHPVTPTLLAAVAYLYAAWANDNAATGGDAPTRTQVNSSGETLCSATGSWDGATLRQGAMN